MIFWAASSGGSHEVSKCIHRAFDCINLVRV
jgi:hypothetical protein